MMNNRSTWQDRALRCHQKTVEVLTDHPDWSYAEAVKFASAQAPELFNGKDAPAKAAASRVRAQKVDAVVKAVQAGTDLSYEQAWGIAKAQNADLFRS